MKLNVQRLTSSAQRRTRTAPIALTIAGSDSSAGAGIQADLKTFSALGVYGLTAVTCVVAETPGKVSRIEPLSGEIVREQIAVLARNFPIGAAKTGLLYSAEIVETVTRAIIDVLRKIDNCIPLVIDPVTVATSGDLVLCPDAIALCESQLFPLATLLTPNLDEAGKLIGESIHDLEAMAEFSAPFVHGVATHGTGCTYSAAITAGLASGLSLEDAVGHAKKFVTRSIAQHFGWTSSSGSHLDALNHSV